MSSTYIVALFFFYFKEIQCSFFFLNQQTMSKLSVMAAQGGATQYLAGDFKVMAETNYL